MENEIKNCAYPGCTNTILVDTSNVEGYCEVCRTLSIRNSLAIVLDPTAPISDRRDMIFGKALHMMKPEEILNAVHKVEWAYLQLQKTLKSNELEVYRKSKFAEGLAEMETTRSAPRAPKAAAKKETKKNKLSKLLGGDDEARKLLSEDFSDL